MATRRGTSSSKKAPAKAPTPARARAPSKAKAPAKAPAKTAAKSKNDGGLAGFDRELIEQLYHTMLLIRRFEERAGQMYGMGLIGGFCHLYIGQEAVVTGLQAGALPTDTVVTTYRDHGHMLATGMDPKGVLAELTGRAGGYSKGKGGSMHMFSREKNFFGGHGIVGASVPIGAGIAFAHKYLDEKACCLTYFGEGALNQGQVYETFNMAALWQLPVIFVIENNRYGMGTSVERHAAHAQELYHRGQAYGIPGRQVDGMDVIAVYEAGKEVIAQVKAGNGPQILEMQTYRYRGHSMSDPAKYRTRDEVQKYRGERDPIENLKHRILEAKMMSEEDLKAIDKRVKDEVADAADFAQTSPEPDPAELWTEVLVDDVA